MAEMLPIDTYMRRYSLFRTGQLDSPVVYPIASLSLPKLSVLHYVAVDGVTVGPQSSDPLMRSIPGIVYIDHLVKYENPIGNPIKAFTSPEAMITNYRRVNRGFRPLRKLDRLEADTRSLVVFNYSILAHVVKYAMSFRAGYFAWYNIYKEVMTNINVVAEQTSRHQFIEINLPDRLPTLTELREYSTRQTSDTLAKFRTPESKTFADLFMWAGKTRNQSLLSRIEPKNYSKVNLLIRRLNGWVVVNLGWLDQFRKSDDVSLESAIAAAPEINRQLEMLGLESVDYSTEAVNMAPQLFQLRMLKMLTQIHQATSPIATQTAANVIEIPLVEENVEHEVLDVLDFSLQDDVFVPESDELGDDELSIAKLEKELEELDNIREMSQDVESIDDDDPTDAKNINVDMFHQTGGVVAKEGEALLRKADELAAQGLLTPAEYRRMMRVAEVHKTLPDPYGGKGTLQDAMVIAEEDIYIAPDKLTTDTVVTDKSLTESRVDVFERQYIDKVLKKDILRAVTSMQKSAIAITGYSIDRYTDAVNDKETHTVRFTPVVGVPSTVKFDIPVLKPNGTFLYNGTNYRMRKQRSDLPIRKVSPSRVALSSYYSKVFVERSERKKFNYGKWFIGQLILKCQDREDPYVSDAVVRRAVDRKAKVPLMYSTIAERVAAFKVGSLQLWFDYKQRIEKFGYSESDLAFEKNGWVLVGKASNGSLIMDEAGMIYRIAPDANGGSLEEVGTVEQLTGMDVSDSPTYMAEMKVYSKAIPTGVALAYLLGLTGLLELMQITPRRVPVGERLNTQPDEYAVRFKNESLLFKRSDMRSMMLFSGFNLYHALIRNYDVDLFDQKDVYSAIFDRAGVGSRYLRELDSMNTLFIDPITEDLLRWMKEPTTYTGLLVRSVEMLVDDTVLARRVDKDGLVESMERVRGYERVAGVVYETLSKAVRMYNARISTGKSSVQVNPNDTMNALIQDPTTAPVNNINPIHALREREVITFGGRGGRSRRAMVASTRLFTDEDMGFISEGTVDSGDVAIITYLSPNSNITSTRGTIRMYDPKRDGAGTIMSTAALLSFGADGDDPKRVNFITVQHGHGIQAAGAEVQGARTGMERVIASRMTPEFATTAKDEGEITEISENHLVVTYKDGEVVRVPLGLIHTSAEGSTYPNIIKTELKVGDKVSKHDVMTYNSGFFKPSPMDKRRVDWMNGCVGRVALREATYTVEDSSSLSVAFAGRMMTKVSKQKSILVDFKEGVNDLVKVGDAVDLDTILCTIQGAVSADAGIYDDATRETLARWGRMAPRAKAVGVVANIEVLYNGDIDDMSESLQIICSESERQRKRLAKRLGVEYTPGRVPRQVRIDGYNLEQDQAIIMVSITTPVGMGIGDKLVIGNQMKSTVGEILFGNNRTLEDEPIDLIFGAKSCLDRIVTSPFTTGSTNTVLRFIGEEAFGMYFGSNE